MRGTDKETVRLLVLQWTAAHLLVPFKGHSRAPFSQYRIRHWELLPDVILWLARTTRHAMVTRTPFQLSLKPNTSQSTIYITTTDRHSRIRELQKQLRCCWEICTAYSIALAIESLPRFGLICFVGLVWLFGLHRFYFFLRCGNVGWGKI